MEAHADATRTRESWRPTTTRVPRVLVVEDEQDIAGLIKHALERSGDARVEIVSSGDSALRAVTCEDHEGNGPILVQQWDGKKWSIVSDWISPMRDVVRPKIEAAAIEEGKKLSYTQRDCSKEK